MVKKNAYSACIIGTGRIGYLLQKDRKREQPASHSIALSKNKRIKIVGASDINKDRLNNWHKDYPEANIYNDYLELLKVENPDIVVIAVNEEMHYRVSIDVIEYKPKLIILEKPVALNLKEAGQIRKRAKIKGIPICINHERRFSKDYNILKEILKNNKLGNIHSIIGSLWSNIKVWDKYSYKSGEGSLIHDGTHLVDILDFLFGYDLLKPTLDHIVKNKKGQIKSLNLHYELVKDKILYLEFNGLKDYFGFEIEIRGCRGRAIIGNGYFKIYTSCTSPYYSNFRSLVKEKKIKCPKKTEYFSGMIANCIDYLDGKDELQSTIDHGINDLKILYRIIDLIKNNIQLK